MCYKNGLFESQNTDVSLLNIITCGATEKFIMGVLSTNGTLSGSDTNNASAGDTSYKLSMGLQAKHHGEVMNNRSQPMIVILTEPTYFCYSAILPCELRVTRQN